MRATNLNTFDPIRKVVTTSGTPERLSPVMTAATIAFVRGTPDTITDSGSAFLTEGFRAGDRVTVTGTTNNNRDFVVASVAAGTLTLTSTGIAINEVAGGSVTLTVSDSRKVEDGVEVVIRAMSSNTGTITVGPSSARALNTNTNYDYHFRLAANQSVSLQVKDLEDIWIDATVSGEGVEVMYER